MNKKTLIICAVFALIISCKNFATGKDIKQNSEGKIKGFVDKILDPVKDKIASSGTKVDEVAKKLQEEEKEELMQGDDPNGSGINPPPVLPENIHNNALVLKAIEQSDGQQEKKVEEAEAKVEENKEKQENTEENIKEKEIIDEQNKQELAKAKEEEQQKEQKRQQEEQQRKAKAEKEKREREEAEQQKRQQEEEEKRQVDNQIKTLIAKINEINENIDVIKWQTTVGPQGVIDRITGPVYDDFTNGNNSIRETWEGLEEESEDEGLGKLLKELSDARDALRTKLNEGNKPYTGYEEPKLKESVNVSEIKSDLEKLKSKLEDVKKYLEDNSKFEEIKGYITDNSD
ncbi:ErpC protein, partial [Borreliella burgdorferi]